MENYHSYKPASVILLAFLTLAGLLTLPVSFPIFLLVIPAHFILSLLPCEEWERIGMIPLFSCIFSAFLVFGLALYDAYSPFFAWIIVGLFNVMGACHWMKSMGKGLFKNNQFRNLQKGDIVALVSFLLVLSLIFFYAILFPFMSFSSGPYPAFAQIGLNIVRTGSFHILLPTESAYNTTGFFYTIGFPGLMAWLSSCLPFPRLIDGMGFVAPWLLWSFCSIFLAIGYRLKIDLKVSLLCLLIVLPSYSIFRIVSEVDSDTLTLPCASLFIYLMIRLVQIKKKESPLPMLIFIFLLWAFSWWIRMHLGLFFSFTLFVLLIFSSQFRGQVKTILLPGSAPWIRPVRVTFFFLMMFVGPSWQIFLTYHTGSPIAPQSLELSEGRGLILKEEFKHYSPPKSQNDKPAGKPPLVDRFKKNIKDYKYDFFPISFSEGWKKNIFKNARSLVHGNTFSGVFTLLLVLGLFLGFLRLNDKGFFSGDGILIVYLVGVFALLTFGFYYYKVLYSAVPVMLVLVAKSISKINSKWKKYQRALIPSACVGFSFIFVVSFLWSGVGTWPQDRRWGLFKIPLTSRSEREWLKTGDFAEEPIRYLSEVPQAERFLYFHVEPGHELAFTLDRRPFWEEAHYDSRVLAGLHWLSSEEKVLRALKHLNIRHLVLTFNLSRYEETPDLDLLPRMLQNKDKRLPRVATSPRLSYQIYRVDD